jgi:hypothetical protein
VALNDEIKVVGLVPNLKKFAALLDLCILAVVEQLQKRIKFQNLSVFVYLMEHILSECREQLLVLSIV